MGAGGRRFESARPDSDRDLGRSHHAQPGQQRARLRSRPAVALQTPERLERERDLVGLLGLTCDLEAEPKRLGGTLGVALLGGLYLGTGTAAAALGPGAALAVAAAVAVVPLTMRRVAEPPARGGVTGTQ